MFEYYNILNSMERRAITLKSSWQKRQLEDPTIVFLNLPFQIFWKNDVFHYVQNDIILLKAQEILRIDIIN